MNETETLEALQKTNRVLKKQLERSISDRQRLELANRQRESLLKDSIRALEESKAKLEQEICERQLAEAKLEEILKQAEYQSALLRNVIDSSPDWIFVKDCQFRYILANDSFANSLGKSLAEILGKTDAELGFLEAEVANFQSNEIQVLRGENIYIACESVTPVHGSLTWIETQKIPLREHQGDIFGILGICRNITQRKQAEAALKQSEDRFDVFMRHCPAAWITDSQGLILYTNETYPKTFQLPIQNLVGKTVFDIFPEEIARQFVANVCQVVQSNQVLETIEQAIASDGSLHYFLVYKFAIPGNFESPLVGGIALDITDRKHAEEALRMSMEQFQFLANSIPQIIWTADSDGSVDYYNQQMYDYSGMTFEQLQGWGWKKIIHPDDLQTFVAHWKEAIATGEMLQIECRLLCANGTFRWHLARGLSMRDEQGNVVQLIVTVTDIDDHKKAETELRESRALAQQQAKQLEAAMQELTCTQAQIVHSEKMSSLGQLVAGVAHEINNPVTFISGNLFHAREYTQDLLKLIDLYQKHYPHPVTEIKEVAEEIDLEYLLDDLPQLLNSMQVGAERIENIVRSLRNFSRMDESEIKAVDIHEGIDSTLMILQNRLKDNPDRPAIELTKNYHSLPLVECYAGQLNQVFMNILTNAIDALEERDKKRTFQEIKAAPSQIIITTEALSSQQVRIRIADNGPGISETVLQRLFDPFFTTKPIGKGTGLGMSISYQIIKEKHQGILYCNSQLGKGAEFVIEIPLHQKC
ncbi:PAS domain S-box protein [Aerosakkonemataceae cyanobacterium BLCC-F154]|uniref:histidine kinase n=1 Tax=Floridaenema fluviatile BLCC-F154 TaxID=3153640 RepID=A0ABV4Y6M4_9CYAN